MPLIVKHVVHIDVVPTPARVMLSFWWLQKGNIKMRRNERRLVGYRSVSAVERPRKRLHRRCNALRWWVKPCASSLSPEMAEL
jgi:hypothetical protein